MRKFLTLAAAVAILALGSVTQAKAQAPEGSSAATIGGTTLSKIAAVGLFGTWTIGGAYLVYQDIAAGGLTRKYAEVTPGAGYGRDVATAAKLTHEFNVAMGYSDDADTTKYLASAGR